VPFRRADRTPWSRCVDAMHFDVSFKGNLLSFLFLDFAERQFLVSRNPWGPLILIPIHLCK
jgi:hypothetical protein